MLFNIDKCKTLPIGGRNLNELYNMEGRPLESVHEEHDLGIMITKDLKCCKQCLNAAKAANKILGMITRTFTYISVEIIYQLYKSLVRPRLEYCIQAWCLHLRKDIDLLEKVQRRATRLIYSLHDLPCYDRLKRLKLTTLVTRRVRGDFIEVFKIIKGFEEVASNTFFKMLLPLTLEFIHLNCISII